MKIYLASLAVAVAFTPVSAWAVSIDLVPIGNPGNAGDVITDDNNAVVGIFGRVTSTYQIGKLEVTNAQYIEFLNAKAGTDPLELYNILMGSTSTGGILRSGTNGSYSYAVKPSAAGAGPGGTDYTYGDKPVNYVSWYDAIRFANWMNNGQGSGSTEAGAYTILGGSAIPSNANSIARNTNATWFLPNEDEWYKAAYYDATTTSYFDYPTAANSPPNNNLPSADTGNSANFKVGVETTTGDTFHPHTSVGAYLLSDSPYGTFDQGGNVGEWNETPGTTGRRVRRGGDSNDPASYLASATRETVIAAIEDGTTGFRLASAAALVGIPGDYNANGVVDAADYALWRHHLGTSFQLMNEVADSTPGAVTPEDYTAWRGRFGNSAGLGGSSTLSTGAVPEPAACAITLLAILLNCGVRFRHS